MADDLDRILEAFPGKEGSTHYTDCHLSHPECAVAYLVRRVREAEEENEQLRRERYHSIGIGTSHEEVERAVVEAVCSFVQITETNQKSAASAIYHEAVQPFLVEIGARLAEAERLRDEVERGIGRFAEEHKPDDAPCIHSRFDSNCPACWRHMVRNWVCFYLDAYDREEG